MESILAIVDGKSFGADLLVGADEGRLDEAFDAVCRWVFHERVSVDLDAELRGEKEEGEMLQCVL